MAPSWTPDKLKRLFELFSENYDQLFFKSGSLLQRKMRKDTFEKIAKELDMPFQVLKFKYFNLNNAYNAEIKKIEAAQREGFFYRPTLPWFKDYREIMEKVDEFNKMGDNSVQKNIEGLQRDTSPEEENVASEEELNFEDEETSYEPSADTIVVSIKQEYIDGLQKEKWDVDFEDTVEQVQIFESPKSTPPFPPPVPPTPLAAPAQLSKVPNVKKPTKRPLKSNSPAKADEFQLFADHIAEQLRNMTISSARKMQCDIHIIFDEEGFPFYSPVLDDE